MTRLTSRASRRLLALPILILLAGLALSSAGCRLDATPSQVAAAATPLPSATAPAPLAASGTPTPWPTATWVPTVPPATATPSPTPLPAPTFSPALVATMQQVESEVEAIRGLEMSVPLTLTVKSRTEFAQYMESEFAEDYPPEEVAADTRVLAVLDLVDEDIELQQVLLDLYSSQVLGVYDDQDNSFIVVNDGEFDLLERMTYAHEYVHGLQDEHFNLTSFIEDGFMSDDEILARLAVVEGDATLAMSQYFVAQVSKASSRELRALTQETPDGQEALDAAPPILRETLAFPYTYGTEFLAAVAPGGWKQVNALFSDPPQSTEQILHPEKYLERDQPVILSLPPLTDTLGTAWQKIEDNVLGEFQLGLYMGVRLDGERAAATSAGWGGDRYVVYVRDDDEFLALATTWDSEAEREEFSLAYEEWASAKYGREARQDGTTLWWETPGQVTALLVRDQAAIILVAPDAALIGRALEALAALDLTVQEQEA